MFPGHAANRQAVFPRQQQNGRMLMVMRQQRAAILICCCVTRYTSAAYLCLCWFCGCFAIQILVFESHNMLEINTVPRVSFNMGDERGGFLFVSIVACFQTVLNAWLLSECSSIVSTDKI